MIKAPWSSEQVTGLNRFQRNTAHHAFTCGSGRRSDSWHSWAAKMRGDHDCGVLVATLEGGKCPACNYTQDWAHEFMVLGADGDEYPSHAEQPWDPGLSAQFWLNVSLDNDRQASIRDFLGRAEVFEVLRLMNFQTGPVAHLFRATGADIPRKCEDEQAFVLRWGLCLASEHGSLWFERANDEIRRRKTMLATAVEKAG